MESTHGLTKQVFCAAALLIGLIGCDTYQNAGVGGTGEVVVPAQRLREVESVDFRDVEAKGPATAPATRPAPPAEMSLALEDVRRLAVANNLDLKVELVNPTLAKETLRTQQAAFEALFTTDFNYANATTPGYGTIRPTRQNTELLGPGVIVPLKTGGSFQFTLPVTRAEQDAAFNTLNPYYTSVPTASLAIPLLRGAGLYDNTQAIRVAFYDYQAQQATTKLEVIRVLAEADRGYWRLFAAQGILRVRRQQYDLAVSQLERARRLARFGGLRGATSAPEVDVVRAESGAADAQSSILDAENTLRQQQRGLKRTINQPGLEMETKTAIVLRTAPNAVPYKLDPDKLAAAGVANRMEMLEAELRIAEQTAAVRVARDDTLPLLSLAYSYNVNGLSGGVGSAFNAIGRDYASHTLALHLEVPIGNEAARSRLRQAMALRVQRLATRDQRALQIRQEVFDAVDTLNVNWERILAARKRVSLAARVRDAEVRQFELGNRTSTEVLDAQTRLANAQSDEISALTDYQISQIDTAFATGTLLGAARVTYEPIKAKEN